MDANDGRENGRQINRSPEILRGEMDADLLQIKTEVGIATKRHKEYKMPKTQRFDQRMLGRARLPNVLTMVAKGKNAPDCPYC
jgi:hypothetical protein